MQQVLASELRLWIGEKKHIVLIDVREDWEREVYNIGGIHIPMGELIGRINEVPKDGDVVFYCEKGIRSTIAIQRLEAMGYHNLYNLSGGMKAWKESL